MPRKPWYGGTMAKKFYTAVTVALTGAAILMTSLAGAANLSIGGPSDCDDNAIIRCGAHSVNELVNKYDDKAYVRGVYAAFGISNGDMAALPSNAVEGRVTKQGDVYAGGRLVATNAITGGRQYITGSTKVNFNGAVFFSRPPSVSFVPDSLPAFVSMDNGSFRFAIIASCGNAVRATPVVTKTAVAPAKPVSKPKPPHQKPQKPAPTPTQPTPTPAPQTQTPAPTQTQTQTQTVNQNVNQQVNQSQQVTVENKNEVKVPPAQTTTKATETVASTTPAQQPAQTSTQQAPVQTAAATTPASSVSTLPNTGPGSVVGIFAAANLIGYIGYRRILLRNLG
ncbi:MAG: hypothetical protein ACREJM_06375 [Candidatus Saccharimonadales bacterium]